MLSSAFMAASSIPPLQYSSMMSNASYKKPFRTSVGRHSSYGIAIAPTTLARGTGINEYLLKTASNLSAADVFPYDNKQSDKSIPRDRRDLKSKLNARMC